tara:strand:+ start:2566 stop:2907 length:342 start_codon:yes stop_codon:yes gene_type:complete
MINKYLNSVIAEIRGDTKKLQALWMYTMCSGGTYYTQAYKIGLGERNHRNYKAFVEWEDLMGEIDYRDGDGEFTDFDPYPTAELKELVLQMRRDIKGAVERDKAEGNFKPAYM